MSTTDVADGPADGPAGGPLASAPPPRPEGESVTPAAEPAAAGAPDAPAAAAAAALDSLAAQLAGTGLADGALADGGGGGGGGSGLGSRRASSPPPPPQQQQQQQSALDDGGPADAAAAARTLYIGNLHPYVDEAVLLDIFSTVGTVTEVKIIKDKATGLSAGYGFVAFADPAAAGAALRSTAGRPLYGQPARVNWAFAKADRSRTASHTHLFVGDLPAGMTDRSLRAAFVAGCGPACSDARVMWDHATGRGRGYGFVAFRTPADAAAAIDVMNGAVLGGRRLRVGWAAHRLPGLGGASGAGSGSDSGGPDGAGPLPPPPPPVSAAPPPAADGPPAGTAVPDPAALSAASPGNTNVYVGALPPGTEEGAVSAVAGAYGPIASVRAFPGAGFAFVEFVDHASALAAIVGLSTTGWSDGRRLKVSWGRPPGGELGEGRVRARGGGGGGGTGAAAAAASAAAQAALMQQYVALGLLPPGGGEQGAGGGGVGGGGGGGGGGGPAAPPASAAALLQLYGLGGAGGPPPPPPPHHRPPRG